MKMVDPGKISAAQLTGILITAILPTALLFAPAAAVKYAGRDAWLTIIISISYGLVVGWVSVKLGSRFPSQSLTQYSCDILGKIMGKLLGLGYIFYFVFGCAVITREFGEFLVIGYMPRTPLLVFNIVLIFLAAYAVRNGFEVIARMNQFVLFLMFGLIFLIYVLIIKDIQLKHLLPFMENGFKPLIRGGLTPAGWNGEIFLLTMFLPYLNNLRKAGQAAYQATLIVALVLLSDLIIAISVLGEQNSKLLFPVYFLAYYIDVAGFFQRIESVILALWVAGVTVKVAIWYYAGVLALAQVVNSDDYKPLVFPVAVIMVIWSITLFDDTSQLVVFFGEVFPLYSVVFQLVFPLGLLLLAFARKKGTSLGRSGKSK